jgi:hypothetical protein
MSLSLAKHCIELTVTPEQALLLAVAVTRRKLDIRPSTAGLGRNQRDILVRFSIEVSPYYSGAETRTESAARSRALRTLMDRGYAVLLNESRAPVERNERVR